MKNKTINIGSQDRKSLENIVSQIYKHDDSFGNIVESRVIKDNVNYNDFLEVILKVNSKIEEIQQSKTSSYENPEEYKALLGKSNQSLASFLPSAENLVELLIPSLTLDEFNYITGPYKIGRKYVDQYLNSGSKFIKIKRGLIDEFNRVKITRADGDDNLKQKNDYIMKSLSGIIRKLDWVEKDYNFLIDKPSKLRVNWDKFYQGKFKPWLNSSKELLKPIATHSLYNGMWAAGIVGGVALIGYESKLLAHYFGVTPSLCEIIEGAATAISAIGGWHLSEGIFDRPDNTSDPQPNAGRNYRAAKKEKRLLEKKELRQRDILNSKNGGSIRQEHDNTVNSLNQATENYRAALEEYSKKWNGRSDHFFEFLTKSAILYSSIAECFDGFGKTIDTRIGKLMENGKTAEMINSVFFGYSTLKSAIDVYAKEKWEEVKGLVNSSDALTKPFKRLRNGIGLGYLADLSLIKLGADPKYPDLIGSALAAGIMYYNKLENSAARYMLKGLSVPILGWGIEQLFQRNPDSDVTTRYIVSSIVAFGILEGIRQIYHKGMGAAVSTLTGAQHH